MFSNICVRVCVSNSGAGRTGSGAKWKVLQSAVDSGHVHDAAMRASALRDLVNWHRSRVQGV